MPRRPVVVPVTTAFRVAAPDTLRQVLLNATPSTLAACLRVSQNFYHVAAPILYQDVEFFNDGTSFLEGVLVRPRAVATRSAPRVDNFKVPLLSNIKTLTVNFQKARKGGKPEADLPTNYNLARLPQIQTLRLKFHDLGFCTRCQAYNCDFRYRYTHMDQIVLRTKFKKLVLLPSAIHWQHHSRWPCASAGLEALTIVVNSHEIPLALGSAIGHLARNLAVKLRLIIFSRSVHAKRSPPGHSENMGGPRAPSVLETSIAKTVYHSTKECSAETEVYLVEARSETTYGSSHPEALPSKACAQELFRTYEAKQLRLSGSPKDLKANVVFKDRKDYLMEDVTDEIDAEELVRWKRAQYWEDHVSFYDQYHPAILGERRREYDHYTNHPEITQEAQLIEEYQTDPDILLQDWEDRCVRAEEQAEWMDEEVTMTLVDELV